MDNSFDGFFARTGDGGYRSGKRPGRVGIGLSSIETVAKDHGGSARFTPLEGIFRSEVYVRR